MATMTMTSAGARSVDRSGVARRRSPPSRSRVSSVRHSFTNARPGASARVNNRRGRRGGDASDTEGASKKVSRRALLAGKALFTVGEAFVFPWATEGATRPKVQMGDAALAPFSPAWLKSMLYVETAPEAKAAAKAALLRGEALAEEGKHSEAIEAFEAVYAGAPTEYKMCQRAGLNISKSYKAMSTTLGDAMDKKANEAKSVVWWWGRGTRWPGWYIIAYLSARNVYFTARDDPVGRFTVTEGLAFLVPIWLGLLYVLVQYGIPDY